MKNKEVPTEPIILGKIGSCYGVYGWLKMFSSTENARNIFDYQPWFIKTEEKWQRFELERWRYHFRDIIIKLKGIDNRNSVKLLINSEIIIDASQLPVLEEGFYYWKDLIGCQVINNSGQYLGRVVGMIATGSNDVLVVQRNINNICGIKEQLVPFLNGTVIKRINLSAQLIEVEWDSDF